MCLTKRMCTLLRDESGQTTTEYVLILALVITLVMQLRTRMLKMVASLLARIERDAEGITDEIEL